MKKTLEQLKAEPVSKVTKGFELKATIEESGEFEGIANVTGIMDRGGDVIAPGSFKSALSGFLKNGFIAVGHDWESLPVAYPTAAKDQAGGLKVTARFHTTEEGQKARTVVKERLEAGLSVGLSIGFRPDRDLCAWFETGKAMWKFCEENGITEGLDKASILAWKSYCRLIQGVKELFEYSLVTIPMNSPSSATSAKSLKDDDEPNDLVQDEPLAGKSLNDHLDSVLAAVEGAVDRVSAYKELRESEGRQISPDRLKQLSELHMGLGELIESATPKQVIPDDLELRRQQFRASQMNWQ